MADLTDADKHLHLVPLCVLRPEAGQVGLVVAAGRQERPVVARLPLEDPVAVDKVHQLGAQLHLAGHAAQVHQLEEFPLNPGHPAHQPI